MRKTAKNRKSGTGKSTRNASRLANAVHFENLETRQLMATINVTDFGAKANDGGDDRQAVLNAINASHNGDTILFSGGTFNFSDEINVPGNRTYKGTNGAVLKGQSSSQGELVKMQSDNATFTGLTFDGGGLFMDHPGGGRNTNILVDNNTFKLNTSGQHRSAITMTSGLSHSRISNNYFTGYNGEFGIYGYNYDNLTINNNEFVNIGAGIHIDAFGNCGNLLVEQNYLTGTHGMGFEFQTTGSATPGSSNLVFQDNWFEHPNLNNDDSKNWNSFAYSLPLDKGVNVTIRRNTIIAPERPGGGKGIRIAFEVGGDNTVVEDNYVYGTNHVVAANDGMGSESVTARNNKFVNYLQGPGIAFPASNRTFTAYNNGPNVRLSDVMEARIASNDKPGIGSKRYDGSVQPTPNPTPTPDPDPTSDPVQTEPAAPTNLVAMVTGATTVNLFWTDKSNNENGYKVERSSDGQNWTTLATLGAGAATYTATGLTSGQEYKFRVRAFNDAGSSDYTNKATVTPAAFDPSLGTYLSDLDTTSESNFWGPAERDMSNGEQPARDGHVMTLGDKTYAKGLGVHSPSELHFALDGKYSSFLSDIGVDGETDGNGSVQFEVWVDGVEVYTSDNLTSANGAQSINVDVTGKQELMLIVNNGGDNRLFDHADWAGARLITAPVVNPDPQPSPQPQDDTDVTYLSDLEWASATNYWGPVEKDMSNGEQAAGYGHALTMDGQTYAKGLGVHSKSDVKYSLNGKYGTFKVDIGLDDEVGENGSAVFQVYADGVELYNSGTMTAESKPRSISVNVQGRKELRLHVGNAKDDFDFDHADWANARLTPAPTKVVYVSDLAVSDQTGADESVQAGQTFNADQTIQGQMMRLNRRIYGKGLGVESDSKLIYQLDGQYDTFSADLGIDDEVRSGGSVIFRIYTDGELAYDSGLLNGASATKTASVNVAGKNELWLVVDDAGDGTAFDHADWANARLVA